MISKSINYIRVHKGYRVHVMSNKSVLIVIPFIILSIFLVTKAYFWRDQVEIRLKDNKDILNLDISLSVASLMYFNDSLLMFNKEYDSAIANNIDSYLKIILETDYKKFSDKLWERYKKNNILISRNSG